MKVFWNALRRWRERDQSLAEIEWRRSAFIDELAEASTLLERIERPDTKERDRLLEMG